MKNIIAENFLRFAPKNLSEADSKKIQRLTEQAPTDKVSNLTITTIPTDAVQGPLIVQSGDTEILTLGAVSKGVNAINAGDAVMLYLGNSIYMILGMIGKYDVEKQIVLTPTTGMYIYKIISNTNPNASVGDTGGFAKPLFGPYNTANPENAVAIGLVKAFENMGEGAGEAKGKARDFYNKYKANIVKAFQMATQLGIKQLNTVEAVRDKNVLTYIEQAK